MRHNFLIYIFILISVSACGVKKSSSISEKHIEETITVVDTTKSVKKIELDKQYISTQIQERIVTFYAVKFDTIYVDSVRYINPIYYPERVEEDREIETDESKISLHLVDSILNAFAMNIQKEIDEDKRDTKEIEAGKGPNVYILILIGFGLFLFGIILIRSSL